MSVDQALKRVKENIFNLLAIGILACFAGVWFFIMKEVADFTPSDEQPTVKLATGIVTVAGLLGTTIATITASALGFTVAKVEERSRSETSETKAVRARAVGAALSTPTLFAVITYVAVSIAVFVTWVANEETSPDVLSVFALSSIGWLVGSASVAFKTEQP